MYFLRTIALQPNGSGSEVGHNKKNGIQTDLFSEIDHPLHMPLRAALGNFVEERTRFFLDRVMFVD